MARKCFKHKFEQIKAVVARPLKATPLAVEALAAVTIGAVVLGVAALALLVVLLVLTHAADGESMHCDEVLEHAAAVVDSS